MGVRGTPVSSRPGGHRLQTGHPSGPLPALPPVPSRQWSWRPVSWLAWCLPLAPLPVLARAIWKDAPGLQQYAGGVLGLGATLCLLACLSVTPASRVVKWKTAARWRRWFGLCMFILGAAGLAIAALYGPHGLWLDRLSGHAQPWTGTAIVAVLVPLAVTSSRAAQKLLGSYWKTWQRRLTWAAWAVLAVHVLTLAAWQVEASFFMASGPLVAARIPSVRKDASQWKASGYADSARWVLTGMLAGIFGCGVGVLAWLEVLACVQAIRFT